MSSRTEINFSYEPADFFEVPYRAILSSGRLVIEGGRATITLSAPTDTIPPELLQSVRDEVLAIFQARQLLQTQSFELRSPSIRQQRPDGVASTALAVAAVIGAEALVGSVDVIVARADGTVGKDTRAERIAAHEAFIAVVAPKIARSPRLRAMVQSYQNAMRDRANALVHLYEVRESASTHFGDERSARDALKISKTEWQKLGWLANEAPLAEGRHRGKKATELRPARASELDEARFLALRIIEAFATVA